MEIRLDASSSVPVYAQIVEQIKALVASRAVRPGDLMPSVRELATTARINRNTVAKAYQVLEAEGIVETRAGQGTFVAEGGTRWSLEERLRRLEACIDRALVEGFHLQLPPDEVRAALERRLDAFARGGARSARTRRGTGG